MSGRGRKGGTLFAVFGIIAVCVGAAIVVNLGAWNVVADAVGGGLRSMSSSAELGPGVDDMGDNDLSITLEKPQVDLPEDGGSGAGWDWVPGALDTSGSQPPQSGNTENASESQNMGPLTGFHSELDYFTALDVLSRLKTAQPHLDGYRNNREQLFGTWANSPTLCGDGTTRDMILQRDLADTTMNNACRVTTGTLHDPYTGDTIQFNRSENPSAVQIDHIVAVQDAWASGMWNRSSEERVEYANDPEVLIAASGSANQDKSSGLASLAYTSQQQDRLRDEWDGEIWLPDNTDITCDYISQRVYIKDKYDLTMTKAEKQETTQILQACATTPNVD